MTDSPGTTPIADMAALPGEGGGKLDALYSQVGKIKSEVATQAAESFRAAATSAGERGRAVQDAVDAVEGKWHGEAAEAFVGYMNRFTKAGSDIQTSLSEAATSMDGVAERLQRLKTDVDKALSEAADEGKRVNKQAEDDIATARGRLDAGEPPENVPDPARIRTTADTRLKAIRDEVERTVENLLETAEADLSELMGGIKVDLDGDGFCGIQPPASDSTTASSVERAGPAPRSAPEVSGSGGGGSGGSGGGGYSGGGGGTGGGGGLGPSGGPPSSGPPPGNVDQWIREAIKILRANGIPVTEDNIDEIWTIIEKESGGDPHAVNNWDCVPLNTEILTKRGWLKHNEVEVGDHTIGHNSETGRSEWTRINRVVHHEDAPLVRIGNSRWHATTTPNHRWLNMPRISPRRLDLPLTCPECGWCSRTDGRVEIAVAIHRRKVHGVMPVPQQHVYATEAQFVATSAIRSRDRILLATPAETDPGLDVTTREAALLGWIAGDGHVETRKHRPTMSVAQSKPSMVARIEKLLEGIPHAVYVDDRGGCGPRHQFRLDHDYAGDLRNRVGHPKSDAVSQVIAMSTAQRLAWLEAITDAEGTRATKPGYTKPQVMIYQAPGTVLDAIALAVYLSGARPRVLHSRRSTVHEDWSPEALVRSNNPVLTGAFLTSESAGRGDVWCVSTALGTWTAMEDEHIFLTGNSNAAKGTPSKGLMQCIDPTFQAHKLPGHDDIYNPVDNIIAGVRYTFDRYGGFEGHPGLKSMAGGGGYQGY